MSDDIRGQRVTNVLEQLLDFERLEQHGGETFVAGADDGMVRIVSESGDQDDRAVDVDFLDGREDGVFGKNRARNVDAAALLPNPSRLAKTCPGNPGQFVAQVARFSSASLDNRSTTSGYCAARSLDSPISASRS